MDGYKERIEIMLLNIQNTLLTIEAIILDTDMSDEKKIAIYKSAISQIDNNVKYEKTLIQSSGGSQNQQGIE